jgi:hypothetical protein
MLLLLLSIEWVYGINLKLIIMSGQEKNKVHFKDTLNRALISGFSGMSAMVI